MYPRERILRDFLRNSNGILSKTYIETLRKFYGEDLARLTFIHSLERFVNDQQLIGPDHARDYGDRPYALLMSGPEATRPEWARKHGRDLVPYIGAFYCHSSQLDKLPLTDSVNGHALWVEVGSARDVLHYHNDRHPTPMRSWMAGQDSVIAGLQLERRNSDRAERPAMSVQGIRKAYNSKAYDLLATGRYTDSQSVISAINADDIFSCDNWRAWTQSSQ